MQAALLGSLQPPFALLRLPFAHQDGNIFRSSDRAFHTWRGRSDLRNPGGFLGRAFRRVSYHGPDQRAEGRSLAHRLHRRCAGQDAPAAWGQSLRLTQGGEVTPQDRALPRIALELNFLKQVD